MPPQFEGMVLRNLHAHNCRGLVLSWAKLRQAGHGHVNNHMPDYLAKKLDALGYFVNHNVTHFLRTGTPHTDAARRGLNPLRRRLLDAQDSNGQRIYPVVNGWIRKTVTVYERHTPVHAPGCLCLQ